jgi:hypothetical protein
MAFSRHIRSETHTSADSDRHQANTSSNGPGIVAFSSFIGEPLLSWLKLVGFGL